MSIIPPPSGSAQSHATEPRVAQAGATPAGGAKPPSEWLCDCGAWVPIGYGRHTHATAVPQTVQQMIAAHDNNEDPFPVTLSHVWRRIWHKTR